MELEEGTGPEKGWFRQEGKARMTSSGASETSKSHLLQAPQVWQVLTESVV